MTNVTTPAEPQRGPLPAILDEVDALCERALFLQAYAVGTKFAPLEVWEDAMAKVRASRIAANLGARSLSRHLTLAAFRSSPREPDVNYALSFDVLEMRGPLELWQRLDRLNLPPDTAPK
jgi:hypothetical protein